jgi:hypothetical protein
VSAIAPDQQLRAEESELPSAASHPFRRYLAILLLLPAVVLLLTLPFAASQTFLRISRRPLWHATQYRYILPPQQNCEVVIAGDSSGMIGVDPQVLEARTGWKTCNLALPYVATAVAGTRVLDAYLAHNRPPRFIVFHLSGNHLRHPQIDEDNGIVDAWLMADEHFPAGEAGQLFLTHPRDTLRFVAAVWKEFLATQPILRPDWSGATYRRDMQEQAEERGWMPQRGTTPGVVCGWQASAIHIERSYLDGLAARYSRGATQLVVWANPARDCDQHIAEYRQNAAALGLAPAQVYDRALFFDAFHLNTEGAAQNAAALANSLQSLKR